MSRLRGAVLLGLALAGCNPTLTAQSVAPPGRTARLEPVHGFWTVKAYELELSAGVASGVTCHEGGPCHDVAVTSDDPAIAEARPAAFGGLEPAGLGARAQATSLVIVGKTPGVTRMRLTSREGSRTIRVTVVAPPLYGTPTTAATR
ncbi:MAG: hypothetical protein M3680_02565 [Myxococcota bacterium]|nr:hypothetical protein [Myxococcota bacterium]